MQFLEKKTFRLYSSHFFLFSCSFPFRKGFYIAVENYDSCMSIISLRVFYHFCPSELDTFAEFPQTAPHESSKGYDPVYGTCVKNTIISSFKPRKYFSKYSGMIKFAAIALKWVYRGDNGCP